MSKKRVLFLCTGNSCRSQMAEAIVNATLGEEWQAVSAGTHPEAEINPFALRALREIGIKHKGRPKKADGFRDGELDVVVTVCDSAAEECPLWLGRGKRLHRGFPDPATAKGSDEEIMQVYRQSLQDILREIPELLATVNLQA